MRTLRRNVMLGFILGALLLGGLAGTLVQAQTTSDQAGGGPGGAPGARQALESFFQALTAGDLVMFANGGAISGTIQADSFTVTPSDGSAAQTLQKSDLAMVTFTTDANGATTAQFVEHNTTSSNSSGNTGSNGGPGRFQMTEVTGTIKATSITLKTESGDTLSLPLSQIGAIMFQINFPSFGQQGQGNQGNQSTGTNQPGPRPDAGFFIDFRGLRSQNLFAEFAKSVTNYDLAVFANNEVWSGTITNTQFLFHSALFGDLTLKASDVSSIQLASDPTNGTDYITMKTGDVISGTLDQSTQIQFQPLGLTDSSGNPVTKTFKRGDIAQLNFKLPASAFGGGGGGPGFGGGPGH